ncbi:Crp/Fnr family transcriptional regulator [Sphingomonas parva]|uniref:Crp/Fnr family transcriptional regulator n=2 Tax=Sphingomonas parva TaxID=2555898 RepID=A0A4Y8ZVU2_9SPHN|nr:Crp/Fnr family transcriptional regulator [Sphingomonas parva]
MVRRLESRSPLAEGEREALLGLQQSIRKVAAGAHLVRDGEPPEQCALLLSGFAYRYKITGDGARQIVSLHIAGEFVDLQNSFLSISDHSVQTLTAAEVAFVPLQAIRDITFAYPAIARAMWIDTLVDASIFREWVVNVGRRDSRARVAHILCEFSLRLEEGGLAREHRYELPMTQEQLADAVGLTSVHVNRVLRQLGEEGLISRDRRSITIQDWQRLRDAGDFNERYLHHDGEAIVRS